MISLGGLGRAAESEPTRSVGFRATGRIGIMCDDPMARSQSRQFTWRNVMRVQVFVADKIEGFAARLGTAGQFARTPNNETT
jgi:hypothetical protein